MKQPTPLQIQSSTVPNPMSTIPMVSMTPTKKICVTQSHSSTNQIRKSDENANAALLTNGNDASTHAPQSPESLSQQLNDQPRRAPKGSRPSSYHPGLDDDPIKETNSVDRNSSVIPGVNDDKEPILEANVAEQVDQFRRSMNKLYNERAVENVVEEATLQNDDDSEPLL